VVTKKIQEPAAGGSPLVIGVGAYLAIFAVVLLFIAGQLWSVSYPKDGGPQTVKILWMNINQASQGLWLALLVIVTGALGSLIHAITSFTSYVGNRRFYRSWAWWYALRPLIGASLALIFYLVLRGGFLAAGENSGAVNHYGMAAIAGLVGMFSKQATDKLSELFDDLFRTREQDDVREDKLTNPEPILEKIEPPTVEVGATERSITIIGKRFVDGSVVQVDGKDRATEFVAANQLKAKLEENDIEFEGELKVAVVNPEPGGGRSGEAPLLVK